MSEIITANELVSGATVYLDVSDVWQTSIDRARVFLAEDAEVRDGIVAAAKARGHVVSVEVETVKLVDGRVIADRLRERIRAEGPTAPYGPKRQDLNGDSNVSL